MTVVVSAHLDDAVLSCAAHVATCSAVITVFAGVPPSGTEAPEWDQLTGATDSSQRVRDRRLEDRQALAVLSGHQAQPVHLDFLDRQYKPEADPFSAIAQRLAEEFAPVDHVLAPAAIGSHPDHVVTRDAALAAASQLGLPVTLYADLPYSIPYGWCQDVSGRADGPYLDRTGLLQRQFRSAGLDCLRWQLTAVPLDRALQEVKRQAMSCYRSQLPALDQGTARVLTHPHTLAFEAIWTPATQPPKRAGT